VIPIPNIISTLSLIALSSGLALAQSLPPSYPGPGAKGSGASAARKQPPAPVASKPTGIAPGQALAELQAGNQRYLRGGVYTHSWLQERIQKTGSEGQSPSVAILSCADSRVPVELIFDQGVGSLFVVRIAGNFQSEDALGTFEFGFAGLGCHTLMVLGHTECGAVAAARAGAQLPGNMSAFVRAIRPGLEAYPGGVEAIKSTNDAAEVNVRWQLQQLLARSEILRKAKEDGKLQVLMGIYDVTTGVVRFIN
jgi:carbonic anhydrase